MGNHGALMVNPRLFHNYLKEYKQAELALIQARTSLPIAFNDNLPISVSGKDMKRMYITMAIAAWRLLQELQKRGHNHLPSHDWDVTYGEYSAENWHRALCLARFALRERSDSRKKTEGKTRQVNAEKDKAWKPVYLDADDFSGLPLNDDKSKESEFDIARAKLEMALMYDEEYSMLDAEDLDKIDLDDISQQDQELENTVQRLPARVNASATKAVRSLRAPMSKSEVIAFCKSQSKKVRVLWSPEDIDRMRKAVDTSTRQQGVSDLLELGRMQEEGEESAANVNAVPTEDAGDESKRLSLLEIKQAMTSITAPLPDYEKACEWAGVDPETRKIETQIARSQGLTLKFWQPQGAVLPEFSNSIWLVVLVSQATGCCAIYL